MNVNNYSLVLCYAGHAYARRGIQRQDGADPLIQELKTVLHRGIRDNRNATKSLKAYKAK